jgi:tetratricopeptide (TPR) repeat protein
MLGNYLERADCYQRILSAEPANSEARYDLGIVYFSMYRFAVERVAQNPDSAYLHQLTEASMSRALTGDLSTLWKSARASPAPENWYQVAVAARRSAVDSLMDAYRRDPDSPKARILLAQAEGSQSHWDEAEHQYRAVLSKDPDDIGANLGLAALYLQLFRFDECSSLIDRVLAERTSDPHANYLKAQVLVLQGHYDEALPRLHHALEVDAGTKPYVFALLAKVYTSQGRWSEAIDALEHAELRDDTGSVQYQLYRLYQKVGKTEAASAALAASRASLTREREREQSAFRRSLEQALHKTVQH